MPNRLQFLAITRTAAALNPLLAMDAAVDYAPLFKGVTTKNLKAKSKQIVADAKKLLKGKTIAKDAPMEHFAELLHHLERVPDQAQLDESVSEPQHKAMEAAAHGKSTLGIPKDVGKEFADADKGKSFDEMLMDWAKDRGMSEDDLSALKKMHADSMPENALDESEEDEEAEDESNEEVEEGAEDEGEPERRAEDRRGGAHDRRQAHDRAMTGKKKPMTQDEVNKAIAAAVATERKNGQAAAEAREFVRPYVGDVSMALDSADKIYRAAAVAMEIEDAATVHPSALRTLIKQVGRTREEQSEERIAMDTGDDESGEQRSGFDSRWGDTAGRIGHA